MLFSTGVETEEQTASDLAKAHPSDRAKTQILIKELEVF